MKELVTFAAVLLTATLAGAGLELKGGDTSRLSNAAVNAAFKAYQPNPTRPTLIDLTGIDLSPRTLTLTAWVMPRGDGDDYRMILFKGNRRGNRQQVEFKFGLAAMVPEFGFSDVEGNWQGILKSNHFLSCTGGKNFALKNLPHARGNHWNFVAAVFDNGRITTYLNGKSIATALCRNDILPLGKQALYLGSGQFPGGAHAFMFDGLLDQIQIIPQGLTSAAIAQLYEREKTNYPAGTIKLRSPREEILKEFDPDFQKKLPLVAAYETRLPASNLPLASPTVTIVDHADVPMLCLDGKVESAMCMMPECKADNQGVFMVARDFAAAGVDYYSEIFWPWMKWGGNCSEWWLAPGKYDFSKVAARLQQIVKANSKARLIVRIKLNVPNWWLKQHPEELCVNDAGKRSPQPTMSSQRWINDSNRMLADLVHYLENSPLAPHIAGYLPAGGATSEWFWWNYEQGLGDYSAVNQKAFRQWLTENYSSVHVLQKAWGQPDVTFETAAIPAPAQRNASEDGFFRNPKEARPVTDYRRFMSDMTTKAIRTATRTVRANLKSRKLVGTFYGYSIYLAGNRYQRLDNLGFQNLAELLDDPDLDFFCAPTAYDRRRGGEEGNFILGYTASLRLHKKLYWDEADMRTHLANKIEGCQTATPDETEHVHWRTFGNSLVHGTNIWWFLLTGNASFHTERMMNQIKHMTKLDRQLLDVSRRSVAQIAMICDEKSMFYINGNRTELAAYTRKAQAELSRCGAPADLYLLSDLSNPSMKSYKLYLFVNSFFITPEQRKMIHEKLKKDNAAAFWFYAPGYQSAAGNSLQTMTELTGFEFERFNTQQPQRFTADGLFAASAGQEFHFNPGFAVKGTELEVLGKLGGRPVAARKGKNFYSLIPPDATMIRAAANYNGIHLYNESGDVLAANASFVMLHAVHDGDKRIKLPAPVRVRELISGCESGPTRQINLKLNAGETVIYQLLH